MTDNTNLLLNGQWIKKLYDGFLKDVMRDHKLTRNEIDVLLFLANNAPYDTARDIAGLRQLAKSQVCKSIDSLMRRGYLAGEPDPHDRRCIHLRLLPDAQPAVREAQKRQRALKELLYAGVTEEEGRVMETVFEKISNNIKGALKNGC